jgi:hypothetical protein
MADPRRSRLARLARIDRSAAVPARAMGLLLALAMAGCTGGSAAPPSGTEPATNTTTLPPPPPTSLDASRTHLAEVTCEVSHEDLLRTWRGYMEGRSGDVQFIPIEPNYFDGGVNHSGPWDYLQDVPLLVYGPGYIRARGAVNRPVTQADLAPTLGALLDFPFDAPDGKPLSEAVVPVNERPNPAPPRLVVTLVWDAGGRNVLDEWPDDHPVLDSLIPRGTWYERATDGSSPSATGPIHATIGTGAFPNHHGLVGNLVRIPGQGLVGPFNEGPKYLLVPAFSDLYDVAKGNEPKVGVIGTTAWYLGMIGHGTAWPGGDEDIAVLRPDPADEGGEGTRWSIPPVDQKYYTMPPYVNDVPGMEQDLDEVDAYDGTVDGTWRGHPFDELFGGFHTPARIPYQSRVIDEVIEREGFGADEVPDLLFLNYKIIDEVGHRWFYNSVEMQDTVAWQDRYLGEFVDFLDRQVGEGRWVLFLTADHGHTPDPEISGAFRISAKVFNALIQGTFDRDGDDTPVVLTAKPTYLFIDREELADNGFTMEQMSEFILDLRKEDVTFPDVELTPKEAKEKVMAAAFPSDLMKDLPCLPEARP